MVPNNQQPSEEPQDRSTTPPPSTPPPSAPTVEAATTSSAHTTSPWALRRAEIECWRLVEEAALDHQHRLASALAEYHQTLKQGALGMRGEEAAALEAAKADSEAAGVSVERRVAIARLWRERVMEIRGAASRRAIAAAKKLSEDQQRSWLDAVEKQREANASYLQAVEGAFASAAATPASTFAVTGDEGPIMGTVELTLGPTSPYGGWGYGWR
jgi:hypothetical protein